MIVVDIVCTGLTATWCDIHGTCTCPRDEEGERESLDSEDCPLHGWASDHPDGHEVRQETALDALYWLQIEGGAEHPPQDTVRMPLELGGARVR